MKKIITAAIAAALVLAPAAAHAAGSDAPTPYTVTVDGITLPDGQTFRDNGHVNIRTTANVAYGLHFEDRNWPEDHPKRAYIGEAFLPWSAFGIPDGQACVMWVQVAEFNEHYGEGGQPAVGPDCATGPVDPEDPKNTPAPEPTQEPEPTEEPTPTPTEEPTEQPTSTPTEPMIPAGSDMTPYLVTGAGVMIAAGVVVLIARRRTEER